MSRYLVVAAVVVVSAFGAPAMAAPGAISGHVQDLDGVPIPDICVRAYLPGNDPFVGPHVLTDDNGDYQVAGLDPGSYKVAFNDRVQWCEAGIDLYVTEWFDNEPSEDLADLVLVTSGATTSGIDATLGEETAILGRVTTPSGQPIDGICVGALPAGNQNAMPYVGGTDNDGYYLIHVPTGDYKVRFYDQGGGCYIGQYLDQWYHDKPDFGSADVVHVGTRATFGVDAVMYEMPSISGHVQDESGAPIAGLCIVANKAHVLNPPGLVPPFAQTDAAGNYEMDIQPGDWGLQFYDGGFPCQATHNWQLQYYNGKYIFDNADVIHVERGQHVAGINVTMKRLVQPTTPTSPAAPPPAAPPPAVKCQVPALRGKTLKRAKRMLRHNHCGVGKVKRRATAPRMAGRVLASRPRAGSIKPAGTKVALVVGKRH